MEQTTELLTDTSVISLMRKIENKSDIDTVCVYHTLLSAQWTLIGPRKGQLKQFLSDFTTGTFEKIRNLPSKKRKIDTRWWKKLMFLIIIRNKLFLYHVATSTFGSRDWAKNALLTKRLIALLLACTRIHCDQLASSNSWKTWDAIEFSTRFIRPRSISQKDFRFICRWQQTWRMRSQDNSWVIESAFGVRIEKMDETRNGFASENWN